MVNLDVNNNIYGKKNLKKNDRGNLKERGN